MLMGLVEKVWRLCAFAGNATTVESAIRSMSMNADIGMRGLCQLRVVTGLERSALRCRRESGLFAAKCARRFSMLLSTASGYGTVGMRSGKPFLDVKAGTIDVQSIQVVPRATT